MSDLELVNAAKTGDLQAFDVLVKRYEEKFLNVAYRTIGNRDEAQDVLQKTFLKIYKGLPTFQQRSQFSTWAYKILMNTCKNHLSSLSIRIKKFFIPIDKKLYNQDGDIIPFQMEDKNNSTKKMLESNEKNRLIQQAIDSLPKDKRTIIILRALEGLSYEQITEITGVKTGTVKTRIFRAREILQKELEGVL